MRLNRLSVLCALIPLILTLAASGSVFGYGRNNTYSSLTVTGATALNGGLTMDTNAFTVANTSGNTAIAGTLAVTGATALNGGLNLGATSNIAVNTNKFTVAASSGNTVVAGTFAANGGITCDTNKFIIADTTGNATFGGTLTLGATSDIAVNTDKFTVAAASGNTAIAGTLGVTGAATFSSTVAGPGAGSGVYTKYQRVTVAAINAAGATGIPLLAAVPGRQYRLINATLSAYGGAFTSTNATSLEIVSDPAGTPVVLYQVLKAQLVRATTAGAGLNNMNPATTSTVLLADNASFVAQVANKGISLITTTASTYDWATATGVDVWITYSVD